jgi:hypothetical protein
MAFNVAVSISKPSKLCVRLNFRFNLINLHVNQSMNRVTQTIVSGRTWLDIRAKGMHLIFREDGSLIDETCK